jgi:hypothetical protein
MLIITLGRYQCGEYAAEMMCSQQSEEREGKQTSGMSKILKSHHHPRDMMKSSQPEVLALTIHKIRKSWKKLFPLIL